MIHYVLQVILFQVFFLVIYDLFLSKETFFTKNRWYLLATPMLSFVIPLIKIPTFQKVVSQEFIIQLPEIVLSPNKVIQNTFETQNLETSINYVNLLFWAGVVIGSILFLMKFFKLIRLIRNNKSIKKTNFILVFLSNEKKAFSFFKYIFLGNEISYNQQEKVIQHELVHVKQKHSLDLLFFELLKIVMWFNPMIYIYQKRITLVHEYISDSVVAKLETKESYITNLLSNFFQVENISFINQFCKKSLIKKRILMMTKNQSKQINQLKYLLLLPALFSMFFYSACSNIVSYDEAENDKQIQTKYRLYRGELKGFKGRNLSYLDELLVGTWPKNISEIQYDDLSLNEQNEYNWYLKEGFLNLGIETKILKMPNGRNAIGTKIPGMEFDKTDVEIEEISFLKMETAPVFPDCEERDFDCFFAKLDAHFTENFNRKLVDEIFVSPGTQKVFVNFSIDINGEVTDVNVKASHIVIEAEAKRVIESLPRMIPGKKFGELTKAKYTLPFKIFLE